MSDAACPVPLTLTPAPSDDSPALAPEHWEESMAEIAESAIAELCAWGLPTPEARRLGARVAMRLCRDLGGTRYYWPRGLAVERAMRDMAIWAEHDGTVDGPHGIRALTRRHNLTDVHIWRILSVQRELHRRRLQPELPGIPPKD